MARGRPRKIEPDDVLDQAMRIFWERGFVSTSMNDISQETGMAKPGLYANFGDKEALYCQSLAHYQDTYGRELAKQLTQEGQSVAQALEGFLKATADFMLEDGHPLGCFIVNNSMECQSGNDLVVDMGRQIDETLRDAMLHRLEQGKDDNQLEDSAECAGLTDFYIGQLSALAVMARKGYSRAQLYNLIDRALVALPVKK